MKKFIGLLVMFMFIASLFGCCSTESKIIEDSKHLAKMNVQNWESVIEATEDPETLEVLKEFEENAKRLERILNSDYETAAEDGE